MILKRWRQWRLDKLEERKFLLDNYYINYSSGTVLESATLEIISTEAKIRTLRRKLNV